ncbi:MAG: fused MFS/spermidine synthase [Thermodesulfovibrionales bacterium]|nr:fused MFS/spermidine synthase [Thermodesulfovibrionales bacterium]
MNLLAAYIITFIASFCILVIEIVAGRILAPFVGVSLYTWTSIIGIVLAGISIGAYIGGKLAHRVPETKTLATLLIISGMTTLLIPPITNVIAAIQFPVSLMLRIFIVTTIIFLIPSCILGMISPVVVKLAIKNLEKVGNVVGKIYAFSTLGSIIGTFAAGFFFISFMGARNVILLMGVILILTGFFVGIFYRTKKISIAYFIIPPFLLFGIYDLAVRVPITKDTYHYTESDYYTIKVKRTVSSDGKTPLEALILDNLTHSYVCLENPLHIEYKYERIYADVLKWKFKKEDHFKTLTIGGGGYTFPRYMEVYYPNSLIDVVEIDPEVTKVTYKFLGLPKDTRIRSFNTDGRWYVMHCKEKYDVIFLDAYNDLSVPYHLTTKEFAEQLKNLLTPNGIILTNIIDNFKTGSFLPSYLKTLRAVYGDKNVHLLSVSHDFENIGISTFIVLASNSNIDIKAFDDFVKNHLGSAATAAIVPESMISDFISRRKAILLTDDYAPVDNLIAQVFEERFGYSRKNH